MKAMHVGAVICFVLAFLFYMASWAPGAYGLGAVGLCFEVVAWLLHAVAQASGKPEA